MIDINNRLNNKVADLMPDKNLNSNNDAYQIIKNYVQNLDKKEKNELAFKQACAFLLLFWNYFELYCDEEEGGGDTRDGQACGKKIKYPDTYLIMDYGNRLVTSVGVYYGSYSTARLIRSVQKMIEMIAERGVKKVRFLGTSVAERVAQEACERYDIRYYAIPHERMSYRG